MAIQTATTYWEGDPVDGRGLMTLGSGHLDEPYSFASRFGDGKGTSPEEMFGAALSGSFSMALSEGLARAGFDHMQIHTSAKVCITHVENEYRITSVLLHTQANVPDISLDKFNECVENAKSRCLVSQMLGHTEVEVKLRVDVYIGH